MGELGKITRIALPALGSLLIFSYLGAKTAPGQINLAQTKASLELSYPNY